MCEPVCEPVCEVVVVRECNEMLERTRPRAPKEDEMPYRARAEEFDASYELPEHRLKLLARLNPLLNSEKLSFLADPHLYIFDGWVASASVSSLIKPYAEAFDADAIIGRMRASRREAWPRLKYAKGAKRARRHLLALDERVLVVTEGGVTVFAGELGDAPSEKPGEELYVYDAAMTDEEIKEVWACPEARNRGTEAHLGLENWFNGEPVYDSLELRHGLAFAEDVMAPLGFVAHGTEIEIFAEREDLAGSIDFLARRGEEYMLVDWKRSRNLAANVRSAYNKKLAPPFQHIDDADVPKYTFQLSIYAWILRTYYHINVVSMALVNVYPIDKDEKPFYTFVPYLGVEVEYLMRQRRELVARRLAVRVLDRDAPICSMSKTVAFDAATLEDGSRVSKKYAMANGLRFVADDEAGSRAEQLLRDCIVPEESSEAMALRSGAIRWRSLLEEGGVKRYRSTSDFAAFHDHLGDF